MITLRLPKVSRCRGKEHSLARDRSDAHDGAVTVWGSLPRQAQVLAMILKEIGGDSPGVPV